MLLVKKEVAESLLSNIGIQNIDLDHRTHRDFTLSLKHNYKSK